MLVILFLGTYVVIPELLSRFSRYRFKMELGQNKSAFLTFDDGPDPIITPQILDNLKELGISATFFVLHSKAEKYPEIMKRIVDGGHSVGSHGVLHTHPWYASPVSYIIRELRGFEIIKQKYMVNHFMYRPPFGKMNLLILLYVLFHRARLIWWTHDPRDYDQADGDSLVSALVNRLPAPESMSSISILLHDGSKNEATSQNKYTSDALIPLCRKLLSLGYEFDVFPESNAKY